MFNQYFIKKEKKKSVLINLGPLKIGGGQNVGLNFIHSIKFVKQDYFQFIFVVARNSDISNYFKKENKYKFYQVPRNPLLRILYEYTIGKLIVYRHNIKIVYSLFGVCFYPSKLFEISGSADSNLFYPDYDFWKHYNHNYYQKFLIKTIDLYRIYGLKKADKVIFETKILEEKGKSLYGLRDTITIKPSINFSNQNIEYDLPQSFKMNIPVGLFLCGWEHNKNFMMIPEIGNELRRKGQEFYFMITAEDGNSKECQKFKNKVTKFGLNEYIKIIGNIPKNKLVGLYSKIDFVFLISNLESFSNNIIEAWYAKKPLIISDEPWSRSICKKSAIYVNQHSAKDISNKIRQYLDKKSNINDIVKNGENELKNYPSIIEKTNLEIKEIIKVFKKL